jgi:hypothetical protein
VSIEQQCRLWVKSGQTIASQNRPMSAVAPIADKRGCGWNGRFGNDSDYFFSHENMKDFRSRGAIFSVTARFLHLSLFSFSFDRLSAAAFSCARSLAAGFAGGPIVKLRLCAIAASGHAAVAPPRSVMNSRRFMSAPKLRRQDCIGSNDYFSSGRNGRQYQYRSAPPMSLLGH